MRETHLSSKPDSSQHELSVLRAQIGRSVWLWCLLRRWARDSPPEVFAGASIRAGQLADAMGISERQVRRDLRRLRLAGLIETRNTGRGVQIRLIGGAGS